MIHNYYKYLKTRAKVKGVRRVENVVYKITKVIFGNSQEDTTEKIFFTGPDHFLGTK